MKKLSEQQRYKRILYKNKYASVGFFLLQLQITLVLGIVLITLTLPQTSLFRRWYLQAELEKMYALFQYAHQKALTLHTDVVISFNQQERTYRCDTITERLSDSIIFGTAEGVKGPPAFPKDHIKQAITFTANRAICYADGTISSGSIYLTDKDKMYTYALTAAVSQASFIRTYRFDTTWVPLV